MFNEETTKAAVNFDNLSSIIADVAAFFRSFYAQLQEFIEAFASKFHFENVHTKDDVINDGE